MDKSIVTGPTTLHTPALAMPTVMTKRRTLDFAPVLLGLLLGCSDTVGENDDEGGGANGGSPATGGMGGNGGTPAAGGGGAGAGGGNAPAKAAVSLDDITPFDAVTDTFTRVPFVAELYDDRDEFDGSFVAADAGDYEVCGSLVSSPTTRFELDVHINGARENALAGFNPHFAEGCRTVRLSAGDVADLRLHQDSGATVSFSANTHWDWMTVHEVTARASLDDSASFTAPHATFTKVPYISEIYDDGNEVDDGRFTASQAGDYQVCASLISPNLGLRFELDLYINGARENAILFARGAEQGCRTVRLAAGDNVEVWVHQDSGANQSFLPNPHWNWMTVAERASLVSVDDIATFVAASTVFTKVPYQGELYDDAGGFTDGRFTAAEPGDYELCASLVMADDLSLSFELDLYINGARENAIAAARGAQQGCRTVRLEAGDDVEVRVYQDSGNPMIFVPNSIWNWMTVSRIQ